MPLIFNWLEKIVLPAINMFYLSRDRFLIESDRSERSIVATIFCHMKRLLGIYQASGELPQKLSIDSEYNKNYGERKFAYGDKCSSCDNSNCKVYACNISEEKDHWMIPDIIIHERGKNNNNQIVIEFKKKSYTEKEAREKDFIKLIYFTCQKPFEGNEDNNYKYSEGYFIDLDIESYEIIPYRDGQVCDRKIISPE